MAKKTVKEIVEEQLPQMEIVETPLAGASDSVARRVKPGPSMADLRKKYLGMAAAAGADAEGLTREAALVEEGDVEVKLVRPKTMPADPAEYLGPRTVIVSKKKGIIGTQG